MVKQAVIAGLLSSGCRVLDIGMCPVPTIQLLVRRHRALGGIAITASHNPAEWNALKFVGSGGVIYPRIKFARDSLVGMALVLRLLAETGQTITELMNSFPPFSVIKEKLVCPSHKISAVLRMLRHEYAGYPLDVRDGVKVILPAGWFLVRGSNTEPIIRVTAEAASETQAREIIGTVYAQVEACINS